MKILKNFFLIISITFFLIIILEILLYSLYKISEAKYFENNFELRKRFDVVRPFDNPEYINELNSSLTKVAIFGGSSSNGHGVLVNFGDYIKNIYPEKFIVHNYSKSGAPFVKFQSEVLNIVAPYYDILIIYSGHNEILSHLHMKSFEKGKKIKLFNGYVIDGKKVRLAHNIEMSLLQKLIESQNKLYFLIINSRLLNFYKQSVRFINKKISKKLENSKITNIQKNPLFIETPVISSIEKDQITKKYFKTLDQIVSRLTLNQKLVISTVLSNDLYPPNLDVIDKRNNIKYFNNSFSNIYNKLKNEEVIDSSIISSLPFGAHKTFIEANNCVLKSEKIQSNWTHCKELLSKARSLDALPWRVIEKINIEIRKIKNERVIVIDPAKKLPAKKKEYLEYFLDFQHPSTKGHFLIADEIIKALSLPKKNISLNDEIINNKCGGFSWCDATNNLNKNCSKNKKDNRKKYINSLNENFYWLKKQIKETSLPYLHEYYLKETQSLMKICRIKTIK